MTHDSQSEPLEATPHLATRRNVIRTAWTVPVIVALGMTPIQAFAQGNGNGNSSSNGGSVAQVSNGGNNGCGNGDQSAPGGSGPNNGAENDQGGSNCPPGSTGNGRR